MLLHVLLIDRRTLLCSYGIVQSTAVYTCTVLVKLIELLKLYCESVYCCVHSYLQVKLLESLELQWKVTPRGPSTVHSKDVYGHAILCALVR
jgi:hypothetical protein